MQDEIRTSAEAHEDSAIPRRHEVHADPETKACNDVPETVRQKPLKQKSPAEWAYERLILYIQNFEEQGRQRTRGRDGLCRGQYRGDPDRGDGVFDPDIVTFYGSDADGARTQLVQHVSQLSVMLRALPRQVDRDAPRRIGFRLAQDLDKENETAQSGDKQG